MAVAAAGNKILFAGGAETTNCTDCWGSPQVNIYDVATNTWSTAILSQDRRSIGAVAIGNKIFFSGGQQGDGAFDTYYDNVDIYDASTNMWKVTHIMPNCYQGGSIPVEGAKDIHKQTNSILIKKAPFIEAYKLFVYYLAIYACYFPIQKVTFLYQ